MKPINFLYWNTGQKPGTQENILNGLFEAHRPWDLLVLGECPVTLTPTFLDAKGLVEFDLASVEKEKFTQRIYYRPAAGISLRQLASYNEQHEEESPVGEIQKAAFDSYTQLVLRTTSRISRIALLELAIADRSTLLACVHFPSKLYLDEVRQLQAASTYKRFILQGAARNSVALRERIIIIGDFNMNPYDLGMLEPMGFHAISNQTFVKHDRVVQYSPEPMFYNPCWSLLGDHNANQRLPRTGGTQYYSGPTSRQLYWHLLDQVLISEALMPGFLHECLEIAQVPAIIAEQIAPRRKGQVNLLSDHLPLLFSILL